MVVFIGDVPHGYGITRIPRFKSVGLFPALLR